MNAQEQIFREFLETYNRIVEECFKRCVYTFNYRYLLDDEIDCTSRCTSRYASFNQRMNMNFADIQVKKMIETHEAAEAAEAAQQLLPSPTTTTDNPTTS